MNFGLILTLLVFILIKSFSQQATEVVLDPEGESIEEFESQIQILTRATFQQLASASKNDVQTIITDFSRYFSINVANVVIFINNNGIEDVDESAQRVSTAMEAGMNAFVANSPAIYNSLKITSLKAIVEESVTIVLQQLQDGKGINDVINLLANKTAQAAFNTIQDFISGLQNSQKAVQQDDSVEYEEDIYFNEDSDDLLAPAFETSGDEAEDVDEKNSISKDGFVFKGNGKTVSGLKQQILLLSESAFVRIENSQNPNKVASDFAVNVTQIVGEVLLTVLNADDDVDKETEAEAISDAVGSALSVGVADSMGPLQMLDIDFIQNQIVAATFNAITSAANPNADVDSILQLAANKILETMVTALSMALNSDILDGGDEQQYEAQNDAIMQKTKDTPENDTIAAVASPPAAGVQEVGASDKMALTQETLTAVLKSSFIGIESDPTTPNSRTLINDMLMAIAQAIGETLLSFKSSSNPQEIAQVIISLFYNALQEAVSQSTDSISNFDINGVVKSIGSGVSKALTDSQDADISTQVQQAAGVVINIIIEELKEVVEGFTFAGNIVVVADNSKDSNIVEKSATVMDPAPAPAPAPTPAPTPAVLLKNASLGPSPEQIAIDKAPLSVPSKTTLDIAEIPKEGNCLCFDEELFDAMVSLKVQEEVQAILQQNKLI